MAELWTAQEIAAATGGSVHGYFAAAGVAFDSREVEDGHLFIALKGEATDGHRFVDQAFAQRAAGAVVSARIDRPHVRVADTTDALNDLGRAARARTDARIVGVTGSVGKTGTKEALFAALDRAAPGEAHRSVKSYNNHTGVPLSLSRMPREARFGVFEMGMNHAGELAALTRLVRPHVAIVTTIASAHREFFASDEAIADAKGEIFQGLEEGGTALIPFDSPHRDRLIEAARPYAGTIRTFGLNEGAEIRAIDIAASDRGTLVTASLGEASLTFTLAPPGLHWVSNALAVLGAVQAVGSDLAAAGLALAELPGLKGRGERHQVRVGDGGQAIVIDESYNANPASMRATLAVLGNQPAARRMVVLGAMRELGVDSDAFHADLAGPILAAGVERAILVGEEMAPLAKALGDTVKLTHVADAVAATDIVRGELADGDVLLVKGSNSIGLAALVEALAGGKN